MATEMVKNRPITPDEVRKLRPEFIPAVIYNTINRLIVENFDGEKAVVKQDDILKEVCNEETGLTRNMVFDKRFLDIEDYYREKGWKVEYDKPAYCESYPAFFTFKA